MKDFDGKRCLITGAASGIGRATAEAMGDRGAKLFLTDINAEGLQEVRNQITDDGGDVSDIKAFDISDYDAVREWADEVHDNHGAMDVVMNIAGISLWGELDQLEHEHWEKCIDVDLRGPIHVIDCFLKETIKAGNGGHLVNVSSAAGLFGLPLHAPYSAAKAGLVGVSEVLRFDLERHDIGVTLVCPGAVETPLKDTVEIIGIDTSKPEVEELKERFSDRAISPENVAGQIINAVEKEKYLVLTSWDMKALYWLKRILSPVYRWIMRYLNNFVETVKN